MPFTEPPSSISGRNSRASNVSGVTGASHSARSGPPQGAKSTDMFSNAGVLSMLKTSTDTGDIGALSFNKTRLPAVPRTAHQRRGHGEQPSLGSSHHYPTANNSHHCYAPSQTSRISDSTSFVRRGSLTSMQSMPPSMPPGNMGKMPLQMPAPTLDRSARESRSYSLTSAPAGQLPRQTSAMSLKSAGHEPRHGPRLHRGHPPMPENRPPYVYPTRLKRPGYRSPSPALSELSAQGPQMLPMPMPQQPQMRRGPMQRPPMPTYNSDYGSGYGPDPHYLNVRPPPRTMSVSPVLGYEQPQFTYQQPGAMRSAPAVAMQPMPYPSQRQHHAPPHHGPPPARYAQPYYGPPRPGYAPHPQMYYPGHPYPGQRGPPPPSNLAPMAHNMFHNAARSARNLPQRMDTPMNEMGTPSSDPPSSGTAASPSSPETPRDTSAIQVAVDPLFIDPALTDLPDSSSEPVLPAKYFEYAEGLERVIDDSDIEVPHPSVPPTGFVQRVKAMLESKAAIEAAAQKDAVHRVEQLDAPALHELAANRFTVIEEFEAPVELPASPVRLPELSSSPTQPVQRLTRELIKAELSPTSTQDDPSLRTDYTDTMELHIPIKHQREPSKAMTDATLETPESAQEETFTTPSTRRQNSTTGSAATTSPEAISGIDYALQFSARMDTTTVTTDETQSKDPFILDADTITLQHQRSKEKVATPQPPHDVQDQDRTRPQSELSEPVSPLQPGDGVSRSSAVSPMHTHKLGIDETLHLHLDGKRDTATTDVNRSAFEAGACDEETLPPPTPRTPRTYSKSVQLSKPNTISTHTPRANRFSLPPDLSTVAETTMNTNSDMITDMAVRFSLPNTTTITIGKPQIVTIAPSSSPGKAESPPPKAKSRGLQPKSARRSTVTFAEQVAPLNIKKPEPRRESQNMNEYGVSKSRSIVRRPSPLDESVDSSRMSRDSTTDPRFPTGNGISSRFGSTHLPGLKEESVEDMSINEHHKRSSSRVDSYPLQLPVRIAAVKAMQERRLQDSAEKAKARRNARHHNRSLAETRDLPSLDFSRMNLIDKLNEALEIRPTKSMEVVRHRDLSAIYCPSPQRPQSTEPLRERYTSFFNKPEDFSLLLGDLEDDGQPKQDDDIPAVEVQESTRIEDLEEAGSRPLSPEDFLNVATQVNRLSIPSVTDLSDRLTSLLPSLKNLHLDSILASDEEIALTIGDIQHLGNGGRRETLLSARLSAGFRTLAERAEDIVNNGTHDSMVPISRLLGINKELPPLPESASAGRVSAIVSMDGTQSYLSGSVSAPTDLGKEPIRPSSALVRHKAPRSEDEVLQMLPPETNPISRDKRPMILSSTSRPWNQDENYPWAGTDVPVDLTIPSEAHTTQSTIGELQRRSRSLDLTNFGDSTDTTRGIDIGSITTNNDCSASITTEQATGVKAKHTRKQSKRSIIGSITRKMGLTGRSGHDELTRSTASPGLKSDDSLPHKPGERYPTSSLTPPVNFHLDEVRSFFSDDSSEKERHQATTFPKRLTYFKGKGKTARLGMNRGASLDQGTSYDAGSLNVEREGAVSSAHTYDGVGMGKAEFRIKRFGEKLRHLFAKGGVLIRSFSNRSKTPRTDRTREDWLSDSLYSGV
ncbi:hypothetical protein LTR08_005536 [Meristemomyces frigidus]|nr:hypothetical protein LTR08_005536 [Meristemomyces frigidus]